jgi:L-2-hydroxyglutarate oxidase LhgO
VTPDTLECDALVIGAGVIGLAVAAVLSERRSVILAEQHPSLGQETSSRNSEVIHSGIYYPPASLKTALCLRGREQLYAFCAEHGIGHARCGKIVVATEAAEEAYLDTLAAHCAALGVPHQRIGGVEVAAREPLVKAAAGLWLPETGIVDSHALMAALERRAIDRGAVLAYRHAVGAIERTAGGFRAAISGPAPLYVRTPLVVNAAGLHAAALSNRVLGTGRYAHRFCRGRYFSLSGRYQGKFRRLVYPVPPKDGLGIHVTIDLAGCARLGPDVDWLAETGGGIPAGAYDCDWETLQPDFLRAVRRYCPQVAAGDLQPALIGIRPKLFIDGKASPDFLVENHDGFIHCLGIESPGLTASLAIAEKVAGL